MTFGLNHELLTEASYNWNTCTHAHAHTHTHTHAHTCTYTHTHTYVRTQGKCVRIHTRVKCGTSIPTLRLCSLLRSRLTKNETEITAVGLAVVAERKLHSSKLHTLPLIQGNGETSVWRHISPVSIVVASGASYHLDYQQPASLYEEVKQFW